MRFRSPVVHVLLLAAATLSCSPESRPVPAAAGARPESSGETLVFRPAGGHEILLRPAEHAGPLTRHADPPTGAFRTTPATDADRVIRAFEGDVVVVDGGRFTPGSPDDDLKIEVEWGDGQHSVSGCGPCRVDHVYRAGRYEITATVHNRRVVDRGSATEAFTVLVQGPEAEPTSAPAALPPNCHTITKPNGACPTGATTFCVSDPVVDRTNPGHALGACNACYGPGACMNFNVTCFGSPTASFQASVHLATLNTGFVYNRTSAAGPLPGDTADFLAPGCAAAGRWAP